MKDVLNELEDYDGIWGHINRIDYSVLEIKKIITEATKEIRRLRKENEELKKK